MMQKTEDLSRSEWMRMKVRVRMRSLALQAVPCGAVPVFGVRLRRGEGEGEQ